MEVKVGEKYKLISEVFLKEAIVKVVNTKKAPSWFDKERKRFCYVYDPKQDRRSVQVIYKEKDKLYLYDYEIKLETITNSRG